MEQENALRVVTPEELALRKLEEQGTDLVKWCYYVISVVLDRCKIHLHVHEESFRVPSALRGYYLASTAKCFRSLPMNRDELIQLLSSVICLLCFGQAPTPPIGLQLSLLWDSLLPHKDEDFKDDEELMALVKSGYSDLEIMSDILTILRMITDEKVIELASTRLIDVKIAKIREILARWLEELTAKSRRKIRYALQHMP